MLFATNRETQSSSAIVDNTYNKHRMPWRISFQDILLIRTYPLLKSGFVSYRIFGDTRASLLGKLQLSPLVILLWEKINNHLVLADLKRPNVNFADVLFVAHTWCGASGHYYRYDNNIESLAIVVYNNKVLFYRIIYNDRVASVLGRGVRVKKGDPKCRQVYN